jgi:hypothetical protein
MFALVHETWNIAFMGFFSFRGDSASTEKNISTGYAEAGFNHIKKGAEKLRRHTFSSILGTSSPCSRLLNQAETSFRL